MKVATAGEMRSIDEKAQADYGLSSWELMEAAGKAMAVEISRETVPQRVCIVAGKGNNAGDGFVVARELKMRGAEVTVICLEEESAYKHAAALAWQNLTGSGVQVCGISDLETTLAGSDVVVDALLGTGISGEPKGAYADAIAKINASNCKVVSADVPSGLRDGLTPGDDPGNIVKADQTLTVGLQKHMLVTLPGRKFAGRVKVLPIQFPQQLLNSDAITLNLADSTEMAAWLPVRKPDGNKGTFGHVGIIGGAPSYAGATVLVARAALRSGCGLATIYALESTNLIYKVALPEAISVILKSGTPVGFDGDSAEDFSAKDSPCNVLCIGPGLGQSSQAGDFLWGVLKHFPGPAVVDADALNILSEGMLGLIGGRSDYVITPHPGEMARLTGLTVSEVQADRLNIARGFAIDHGVTVLLKGADTLVARSDGQVWIVPGAEPALAKGGAGDVLTGVIGALMAQGMPAWQAAVAGATAHLHGGTACAHRLGSRGVLASDVADEVPRMLDAMQNDAAQ